MGADLNNDSIGMNIKRYRKDKKMTQAKLAADAGIERATISKYENGVLVPPDYQIIRIEKALKLTSINMKCGGLLVEILAGLL
ncbi:MAG: helix-turn-helix transcriptional regulator [Clostridiales bacterium]|nr:helix-turn-helix transcriptional regulator [Clostridiales bacterium]